MSNKIKYHYDQQNGIFVKENEISINWLVSNILNKKDAQITKLTNDEIIGFLQILDTSELRMPNGQHALFWLRTKLKDYYNITTSKDGEVWVPIADRYRWILEQIDIVLVNTTNLEEKMKESEITKSEDVYNIKRTPNNMKCVFEIETK